MFAYGATAFVLTNCWHNEAANTVTPSDIQVAATRPPNPTHYLITLGMTLGFIMTVKYSTVGLVGAVLILLLWYAPRQIIRNGVIVSPAAGIIFESRGYYCPQNVTCLSDMLFDYRARPLKQDATPDQVFQAWHDVGDDYTLYKWK